MKLDRNINPNGKGKFALLKLRNLPERGRARTEIEQALVALSHHGLLDYGDTEGSEFFVMRLKDRSAAPALRAYAADAAQYDLEWADEIRALAEAAEHQLAPKIAD